MFQKYGNKVGHGICSTSISGLDLETFCNLFWKIKITEHGGSENDDDTADLIIQNVIPSFPQYGTSPRNGKAIKFKNQGNQFNIGSY